VEAQNTLIGCCVGSVTEDHDGSHLAPSGSGHSTSSSRGPSPYPSAACNNRPGQATRRKRLPNSGSLDGPKTLPPIDLDGAGDIVGSPEHSSISGEAAPGSVGLGCWAWGSRGDEQGSGDACVWESPPAADVEFVPAGRQPGRSICISVLWILTRVRLTASR
jgi:hypothetical protein